MANGTKKVVATTSVANAIPFNFSSKRSSTSFKLDEMVNQSVTIERAVDGKKDKTKRYVFMTIDGRPYAMEQGDLNETKGFKEVCVPELAKQGQLELLPGARITVMGGAIEWKLVA